MTLRSINLVLCPNLFLGLIGFAWHPLRLCEGGYLTDIRHALRKASGCATLKFNLDKGLTLILNTAKPPRRGERVS